MGAAGYYGGGLRAWRQVGAGAPTYFLYDGGDPVVEADGNGNVTAVNTFGADGLVSRHTGVGSGGSAFYTFDPQGGVAQRTDRAGAVTGAGGFTAFGSASGARDPWGFGAQAGGYTDPGTGRFLTRDPLGYNVGISLDADMKNTSANLSGRQVGETRRAGVVGQAASGLGALLIWGGAAGVLAGALLIWGGAAGVLAGALGPWAHVTLFRNITLHVSGLLFTEGELCLSAALLILLGMRRSPLLCAVAALFVLHWAGQARTEIPHRVKHQVIGAQLALFPLNRLLDQFHIDDVQVGDWAVPDAQLLASGLNTTVKAGAALLLGSLLGLPADPAIVWLSARFVQARCRACGARWTQSRAAAFCPQCGLPTSERSARRCPQCGMGASPSDIHCIACGLGLA